MYGLGWNKPLLKIPMISGADVSLPAFEPQEDILNIDIN